MAKIKFKKQRMIIALALLMVVGIFVSYEQKNGGGTQ